ncbi:MAG: hypothetical protein LBF90_03280 [Prevotellaceae bacterium]|jgi:uncharacterized protein YpmB|nr:hypothetical protein [Prevotellaceae bacterium]
MKKQHKKWIIIGVIVVIAIVGYNYYKKHPEKFKFAGPSGSSSTTDATTPAATEPASGSYYG